MGQKVHPIGARLGYIKDWNGHWYTEPRRYAETLISDLKVRRLVLNKLSEAQISRVQIDRTGQNCVITVVCARPGVIIGKKGGDIDKLREQVTPMLGTNQVKINVEEIRKPDLDASIVAANIAAQLERRVMFRRAMKRAVSSTMRAGAVGIRVCVSGRVGGAEIARSEQYREGRVPLHTLRADIDFAIAEAKTTYGIIGVKVWIFRGEVFNPAQIFAGKAKDKAEKVEG